MAEFYVKGGAGPQFFMEPAPQHGELVGGRRGALLGRRHFGRFGAGFGFRRDRFRWRGRCFLRLVGSIVGLVIVHFHHAIRQRGDFQQPRLDRQVDLVPPQDIQFYLRAARHRWHARQLDD